jgi:HJR/Mrr/RecB family endonuclease
MRKKLQQVKLTIVLKPELMVRVDELFKLGTWGNTREETIRMLLSQGIEGKIKGGLLARKHFEINDSGDLIEVLAIKSDKKANGAHIVIPDTLYEREDASSEAVNVIFCEFKPVIQAVNESVLKMLKRQPSDIFRLTPREFEILVMELLKEKGMDVILTPPSRDGGKDIIAAIDTSLGKHLCLVETKLYRLDRPVGVGVIRGLYGVVADADASSGSLITTSYFTDPAIKFAKQHPNRLFLHDFEILKQWITEARC